MKNLLLFISLLAATTMVISCQPKEKPLPPNEDVNLIVSTIQNDSTGIDTVMLRDAENLITALPVDAAARMKPMSDEEIKCLKKCKKSDGSYDLNCILLCPVSKRYIFSLTATKATN